MGLCLIAATLVPAWVITVLVVVVALGMVIFVHELGHFLVAKLCGVKCEKFYLGFDIFGGKLCKFQWGETEYGVGILPLGGYVKMLGQEDNPARLREEIERAQAQKSAEAADAANPGEGHNSETTTDVRPEAIDIEAAKRALFDPRSYLAQSVPKRMAIISAGVIMNVIFALVMAVIAYRIGVQKIEPIVGAIVPGDAAWQLNLKVGDRIVAADGQPIHSFIDLKKAISLGDNLAHGVSLMIERPGLAKPLEVTVKPDETGLAPTIGVVPPSSTTLLKEFPSRPGTPAAKAQPPFEGGDRIVAVDGRPVQRYAEIFDEIARNPEKPLDFAVRRRTKRTKPPGNPVGGDSAEEQLNVRVAPNPMLRLGLVMGMGPIAAVQHDSPAAAAGVRPGDRIVKIDGRSPGDPMTLADRLRRRYGEVSQITLTLDRLGQRKPLEVVVELRPTDTFDSFESMVNKRKNPVSVPALGIAYRVTNQVQEVLPNSPAAKSGLRPGMVIAQATIIPPDKESSGDKEFADFPQRELEIKFGDDEADWPYLFYALQTISLPGTKVALKLKDGSAHELQAVGAADWFNPDRGLIFEMKEFTEKADSAGRALELGFNETVDSLTMVFRTIEALSTQRVSPKLLGGPWTIAKHAYYAASQGMSDLLIFLCLLSANLAVLNFLPIPVLDGGHIVFLAYEGIRGKPPSEAFQVWLSYLGLLLILALMVWVFGLDFGLIPRQ